MRFLKWFVFVFTLIMLGIGTFCLFHSNDLEEKQNIYIDAVDATVEVIELTEDPTKLKLNFVNLDKVLTISRSIYPTLEASTKDADGNIQYSTVRIPNNSPNLIVLTKELHATKDACYRNGAVETGVSSDSVKKVNYSDYLTLLSQYNGNLGNIDLELKRYNLLTLWGFCASGTFLLLFIVLGILTKKEKKVKAQSAAITSDELISQINDEKQKEEDKLARIQQRKDELNKNILIAEEKAKKSWTDAVPQEKSEDLVVTEFTPDSSVIANDVSNDVEVFEFSPASDSGEVIIKAKEKSVEPEVIPDIVEESNGDSVDSMFASDDDFSIDGEFDI